MISYLPKYFSNKAMYLYPAVLVVVNVAFMSLSLPFLWWIFGIVEVMAFFYYSNSFTRKWSLLLDKTYQKRLFKTALGIRVGWVVFSYFFYLAMNGEPFEFNSADAHTYHAVATDLAQRGFDAYESVFWGMAISDRGYGTYLGVVYMIFGNGVLIPRLLKALLGAYLCVMIYKLGKRNFGEETGRMAGIFSMLMPNLIYYAGLHLKEAEMVFLVVAFIERADYLIRSKKYNFINIFLPIAIAATLFFFRTVLGAAALFSLFTALILTTEKVLGFGKRALMIVWTVIAVGYFMGGRIASEVEEVWANRSQNQEAGLEYKSNRKGGNTFAKYASASVFAPMILVIPFPTMVDTPNQDNQKLLNGGYYVKNILAFFTIFSLFLLVKNGVWRDHLLIISFTIGYLIIIALSSFAQSERFHLPALPFVLLFSAYGVSQVNNKVKKYFNIYLVFIFVALIAWSWFKLAGRGMV